VWPLRNGGTGHAQAHAGAQRRFVPRGPAPGASAQARGAMSTVRLHAQPRSALLLLPPIAAAGLALLAPAAAVAQDDPYAATDAGATAPKAPPPPQSGPEDPPTVSARELNRAGISLLDAGDTERALEYFLQSRAAKPSTKNTANAAICLDRMGRYDEALELYEELFLKYSAGLDAQDRSAVQPAMEALRRKVASLAVFSNVTGATVVVDGRERGKLPRSTDLRVLEGKRLVRVIKTGFKTFETTVDARVGERFKVDARLDALKGVGQLVIEDGTAQSSDVFVDGVRVGATPWEGSLAPGKHLVWTRKNGVGSAPAAVTVLEGQTALARLDSRPLGSEVRIRAEPRTATIEIPGAALGTGEWQGRLPVGSYAFTASEPGYRTRTAMVTVDPAPGAGRDVALPLEIDPGHPRWPQRGRIWIEAFGGYMGGGTLDSDAEAACPGSCNADGAVNGFVAGARGGYRFPFGLSLELGGGYLSLATSIDRTLEDTSGAGGSVAVSYRLRDELHVRGPFGAVGVSQRFDVGSRYHVGLRGSVGLLFARSSDPFTGEATTTGGSLPVEAENRNQTLNSAAVFLSPEVGAGVKLGPVEIGAALGVAFFATDGPEFDRPRFGNQIAQDPANPDAVGNAKESHVIANERAYGQFVVWTPRISIGRTF
jgi:hypothetical protein